MAARPALHSGGKQSSNAGDRHIYTFGARLVAANAALKESEFLLLSSFMLVSLIGTYETLCPFNCTFSPTQHIIIIVVLSAPSGVLWAEINIIYIFLPTVVLLPGWPQPAFPSWSLQRAVPPPCLNLPRVDGFYFWRRSILAPPNSNRNGAEQRRIIYIKI